MIRILIVEDDPNIAKTIEVTLSLVGYGCEICGEGNEAAALLESGRFDLCLLDVMLPGADGFEIAERTAGCGTPIIFLTAKGDIMDKVKGLRMGAEDYIVKPFEAMELLARIEVVLRRCDKGESAFDYLDIHVDTKKHTVTKAGIRVDLTPKEFDVLLLFLQNIDVAISRERLLAAVWGYEYYGETRTVDIHIQQIRKKLDLKQHLVTIPKLGYRLERAGKA
ncbi:MAG: response regulator transcription factor [Lachnospiraceae bacterium]|nr:response regulator transcription factor [Lachnospiraceae bacterium]